jgi:hypothetical protein
VGSYYSSILKAGKGCSIVGEVVEVYLLLNSMAWTAIIVGSSLWLTIILIPASGYKYADLNKKSTEKYRNLKEKLLLLVTKIETFVTNLSFIQHVLYGLKVGKH